MNPRKRRHLKLQARLNREKLQEVAVEAPAPPVARRRRVKKVEPVVDEGDTSSLDAPDLSEE